MEIKIGTFSNKIDCFAIINDPDPRENSHTHGYEKDENGMSIMKNVIGMMTYNIPDDAERRTICAHFDMGKTIGLDNLVETTKEDRIVEAHREGRSTITRYAVDREPTPTSEITCVCGKPVPGGKVYLYTIYPGKEGPREIGDSSLTTQEQKEESLNFWNCHALVPTKEQRDDLIKHGLL